MKKSKITASSASGGSVMNVAITFTFQHLSSAVAKPVIDGFDFGKGRRITALDQKDEEERVLEIWMNKVNLGVSPRAVTVQVQYERSDNLPITAEAYGICKNDAEDFIFTPLAEQLKGHDVPDNRQEEPPAPPAPAPATSTPPSPTAPSAPAPAATAPVV